MKKILVVFLALLTILTSVQAQTKKESKREQTAGAIARHMAQRDLVLMISNVMSDWGNQSYPQGIKVTLINNRFTCNLPFQGSSRISTYGSQDLYIKAENALVEVQSEFNEKKSCYELKFSFTSSFDNELFDAFLKIFTNGKVSLEIMSPKRSVMRYTGGIQIMI